MYQESQNRELEIIEYIIKIIITNLNPKKIILFGSRAKGTNDKKSDFDFAIDSPKPEIRKERKLKEEISERSGLYSVDIVFLQSIDSQFKEFILKTGRIIYER